MLAVQALALSYSVYSSQEKVPPRVSPSMRESGDFFNMQNQIREEAAASLNSPDNGMHEIVSQGPQEFDNASDGMI